MVRAAPGTARVHTGDARWIAHRLRERLHADPRVVHRPAHVLDDVSTLSPGRIRKSRARARRRARSPSPPPGAPWARWSCGASVSWGVAPTCARIPPSRPAVHHDEPWPTTSRDPVVEHGSRRPAMAAASCCLEPRDPQRGCRPVSSAASTNARLGLGREPDVTYPFSAIPTTPPAPEMPATNPVAIAPPSSSRARGARCATRADRPCGPRASADFFVVAEREIHSAPGLGPAKRCSTASRIPTRLPLSSKAPRPTHTAGDPAFECRSVSALGCRAPPEPHPGRRAGRSAGDSERPVHSSTGRSVHLLELEHGM